MAVVNPPLKATVAPAVVFVILTLSEIFTDPVNVVPPEFVTVRFLSAPADPITALELITAEPEFRVNPLVDDACDANPETAQDSSSLA